MPAHLILTIVIFGLQLGLLVFGFLPKRLPALDFYKLSGIGMCVLTGAWAGAWSWHAAWFGLLALAWMTAAATEPNRRARRQAVQRLLRQLQGPHQ